MSRISVLFVVLTVFIISYIVIEHNNYGFNPKPANTVADSTSQLYRSNLKEFSVEIPIRYSVDEKFTYIKALNPVNGAITLNRIASEYDSLHDHLEDLVNKNKLHIEYLNEISKQDAAESAYVYIRSEDNENEITYNYFHFVDGWAYSISTSDQKLYGDLERMAESFEYLGN